MSDITKSNLIARIKVSAMSGQGFTPALAVELSELLDDNTRKTVKMSNEYHSRLTEIEKELFGYDRKGRLNAVSADPEGVEAEAAPTQAEAANDADFDCKGCTACEDQSLNAFISELFGNFAPVQKQALTRVTRPFMGLPTIMLVKA